MQHLVELWAGCVAGGDQLAPCKKQLRAHDLFRRGLVALAHEAPDIEIAVRAEAVHAVKGKVLVEAVEPKKTLQRRSLHPRRVAETHVIFNQRHNLAAFVVGEAKTAADLRAHRHSDVDMIVEADAIRRNAK